MTAVALCQSENWSVDAAYSGKKRLRLLPTSPTDRAVSKITNEGAAVE